MNLCRFALLAIIAVWPGPILAADWPEAFLSTILAHDFDGDPEPRFDHVFYPDGRYIADGCVHEECGERREIFYAGDGPLRIIAHWRVIDVRMESKTRAVVTVRDRVIATVKGHNWERRIVPLPEPQDEDMIYRVWKRKSGWKWVEPPPIPRVGFWAVRKVVADNISRESELIAEFGPGDGREDIRSQY